MGWTVKSNDLELHSVVDTVLLPDLFRSVFPFGVTLPQFIVLEFLKACTCPSSVTVPGLLCLHYQRRKYMKAEFLSSACSTALSRDRLEAGME